MTELRPWTWPWLIATTSAKGVLAMVICLGLWGALPSVIGWQPTTVSSGSMLPRLHVGDVAVSRPLGAEPPTLDSVLLFEDPDHPGRLRLHRFVRVAEDGRLVTRGDANPDDDSSPVALTAVRGIGTLRVPWVGLPVIWVREQAWLPLAGGLVALLALTALAAQSRRFGLPEPGLDSDADADADADGSGDGGGGGDGSGDGSGDQPGKLSDIADGTGEPAGRPAGAGTLGPARAGGALLVAALLGLLPAVPAGAAFSDTTTARASAAATPYFTCRAAVTAFSPFLWYRLDETSSTATAATDSSGGGRTGVYSAGGRTAGVARACRRDAGQAMTFDGASGRLSSPLINSALPQVFTLTVWFRTTTSRGGKLVGFGNSATGVSSSYDRQLYMTDGGKIVFGVYAGTARTVTSPLSYNNNAWHQAVATLSGTGMRLYVDGGLVASDTTVTSAESVASGYLRVAYDNLDGWPSTPTSRFFAGTLDDVVVELSALSAAQVEAQYEAGS